MGKEGIHTNDKPFYQQQIKYVILVPIDIIICTFIIQSYC